MRRLASAPLLLLLLAATLLPACDGGSGVDPIVPNDSTVAQRDVAAFIQTDSLAYRWTFWASPVAWWGTSIAITMQNPLPDTLYLLNCEGKYPAYLEKRLHGTWTAFLGRPVVDCFDPPIVIPPGGTFQDRLGAGGAAPGQNVFPDFPTTDIDGVYRLVMPPSSLVLHVNYRTLSGDTLPPRYRYSNPFVVHR